MEKTYKFHCDGGHGWLEVPIREILTHKITDKISSYSYLDIDKQVVYLEEDCDAGVFMDTAQVHGDNIEFVEIFGESAIRELPRYTNRIFATI